MIKTNQNIFDFTLENFGTLENLFSDVLVPNSLPVDQEIKQDQEINIDTFEKGNQTVKKQIQTKGLVMTNGEVPIPPIAVNYYNGIVTNATEGEIAIFDFDVIANFSGAVTFTVNWGVQIGTTIINTTLVIGVSKSLQTTIEIPLGIDASQTVNVTDSLGGSYAVGYTVESSYPSVIEDGNSVGWYIADDLDTITKDVSDFVSVWEDKLGSGHDLLQAVGSNQPKWFLNDGVLFDGIDNFMKALAFTFNQPEQIYIVFKKISPWVSATRIFDGNITNSGTLFEWGSANGLSVFAGLVSPINYDLIIGQDSIGRVLINRAPSKIQIDDNAPVVGDSGSVNLNGFTIGAAGGGTNPANMQVKEILLRKVQDSPTDEQDIYDYLAAKYSI